MDTLTVIAGILSLVSIIVFFVMAANISAMLKEQRKTNEYILKSANNAGFRKNAFCPKCGQPLVHWANERRLMCTKCRNVFDIS